MDCASELSSVLAADCKNFAVAGLMGDVILIPYAGIDKVASTVTDNIISEIALKPDVIASKFESFDNSPLGAVSVVAGTYINTLQHDLTLRIFVKNEDVKTFVNNMVNARLVAIVKNKEIGSATTTSDAGQVTYEAFGWDAGLILTTLTSDTSMADGVVYELVTGNDEISKEKSIPKTVWAEDLAATEAMLNSLLTPPVTP